MCCVPAFAQRPDNNEPPLIGMTMPARTASIGAVRPGRISEIPAAEGQFVEAGALLFTLDDKVQRARAELARVEARNYLDAELAQARWDREQSEVQRLQSLYGGDYASSKELTDALFRADVARMQFEIARADQEEARLRHEQEQALLEEFHVRAPFDGYVTQHLKEIGESVDQLESVLTFVQLDPLQVWVDCPMTQASRLTVGDGVKVRPVEPQWDARSGKIIYKNLVVDGASQTVKIKIEVENAQRDWPAGMKASIEITPASESTTSEDKSRKP